MKKYLIVIVVCILGSCKEQIDSKFQTMDLENDSLKEQLKGLSKELKEIKILIEKKDSNTYKIQPELKHINPTITGKDLPKVKQIPLEKQKEKEEVKKIEIQEFIDERKKEKKFYFKNSKKISLYISGLKDDKREYKLYDLNGNLTYEFESIFKSYSVSVDIKSFHPNGAVRNVSVHTNPGASMYMYQTEYTFSENNEPLTKEDFTTPARLEDFMDNLSVWNKERKQWEKK